MHTRLYAGSPFERAQALGLEGKTSGTDGTEQAERHAIFPARSIPVKRNGKETEHFCDAYCKSFNVAAKAREGV